MIDVEMCAVINAMTASPDAIEWQFPCNDCAEKHTNFAIYYEGQWLTWHNCAINEGYESPLVGCCRCHEAMVGGVAYYGSELQDNENLSGFLAWAKEKGVI